MTTKKIINEWPEWKKNMLGGDDLSSKSIKVLNNLVLQEDKRLKNNIEIKRYFCCLLAYFIRKEL